MIRVIVTGSECTGKTTLAEALADHYSTVTVPEYARQFVIDKGVSPKYEDVETIARGQIELEQRMAAQASRLLILDTDLLSTVVYSHHYYGECPVWIEEELRKRAASLYLLADTDVPWVPDGDQRDRGNQRDELQGLFAQALSAAGQPTVRVSGSTPQRLDTATSRIDPLLKD